MFIGTENCFRVSSKDACARDFVDCVVMRIFFPLVPDRSVGLNLLIEPMFLDSGIILLYIVSESILCTGMIAKLCINSFCFTICCL